MMLFHYPCLFLSNVLLCSSLLSHLIGVQQTFDDEVGWAHTSPSFDPLQWTSGQKDKYS
jgi:hypothetical protein